MKRNHQPPTQRITVTVDVVDEPGNDTVGVSALLDVVRHLEAAAIIPMLIRLEIGPTPTG
ncbi:MAG: hypothetical protein ACRDXE_07015 [Acidimicrobiales bacterium]